MTKLLTVTLCRCSGPSNAWTARSAVFARCRSARKAATRHAASSSLLRLPAQRTRESLSEAEVHQQTGPQKACWEARP